jgi:hypothetical protein
MAWEIQVELKLNGTHQLLVCAAYVNLLGSSINTEKKETLIDTSKEFGLEIITEETNIWCYIVTRIQGEIMT